MEIAQQIILNQKVKGSGGREMLLDIFIPKGKSRKPLAIFCHGFKGFKDWGHFNAMAEYFMNYGIAFIKFNFSHNGIVNEQPDEIRDSEIFGQNNYSKEVFDLGAIIDFVKECEWKERLEVGNISVIGHSRGGSIAFIRALNDSRIKKLIMWASPFDLSSYFKKETIEQWNKEGKVEVMNKRNGNTYPLYKQFYDDFQANKSKLDIPALVHKFSIPLLIIHGDKDEAVPLKESESYYQHVPHAILIPMEGEGHTFGASHPFDKQISDLPHLEEVFENTAEFVIDSYAF